LCQGKSESKTKIKISYQNKEITAAILKAISPDNYQTPEGISIEAENKEGNLILKIETKTIKGMISTIEDLLDCIQAAETAIGEVL
jgi:tRNA threonylcarbamoyladenosine modification (KEOPS) complex  Pcc1 subunit